MSYCEKRLASLGITSKELNGFKFTPLGENHYQQYFLPDANNNIRINYFKLDGLQYQYKASGNKWSTPFFRTRLQYPKGDMKYTQPKGSPTFPFFPPMVVSQYMNRRSIETLFFTEGEFKAFVACMAGVPTVGFPSISGCYHNEVRRNFHDDILDLIRECQVKNLVFIMDADAFSVNYKPDKDMSKRPNLFYTAVRNFYDACLSLQEVNQQQGKSPIHAYWCHIKTEYANSAKGLDDLLLQFPARQQAIQVELTSHQFHEFFRGYLLNEAKIKSLKKTFGITSAEDFYSVYKSFIGREEFRWHKNRYQWDGEELKRLKHIEADKFIRIADDWYKKMEVPSALGKKEKFLKLYKKSVINDDYGKKYPDFFDQCEKYEWFCNMPSINGSYRRVIENCYNLFEPICHEIKEDDIEASMKFLKHLFDNKNMCRTYQYIDPDSGEIKEHTLFCADIGDQFTVAVDWLSILVQHPTQNLPVPCLVSEKEGTGKTTFLKWLVAIFGNNATILDNDRFKMSFNSHYATKFIIGLDEGFLEIEKKAEKERLKQLVTSNRIFLENKGSDVKEIDFFGKLIICSNDADRLMKVDENDSRWFVINVPQFTEENPFLLESLQAEIPAFLHFLLYREIIHPKASRLWFKKDWFITEQLKVIIQSTKNRLDKIIEDYIKDMFITYGYRDLKLDLKWLVKDMNSNSKYRYEISDVREYLKKRKGMLPQAPRHIEIPIGFEPDPHDPNKLVPSFFKTKSRYYHFLIHDWLTDEEIEDFETNDREEKTIVVKGTSKQETNDEAPF